MSIEQLFIKASRQKFRFASHKGQLTVEQLWDLPLRPRSANSVCLNTIAQICHNNDLNQQGELDFVNGTKADNSVFQDKFDIVMHIISVKKAEEQAVRDASAKREQKQKLLGILSNKKDTELQGKSAEEIQKMIDDLS